jgi:hypothetical protein
MINNETNFPRDKVDSRLYIRFTSVDFGIMSYEGDGLWKIRRKLRTLFRNENKTLSFTEFMNFLLLSFLTNLLYSKLD